MTVCAPDCGPVARGGSEAAIIGLLKKSISDAAGAPGGRNRSEPATGLPSGVMPGCHSGPSPPTVPQPLPAPAEPAPDPPAAHQGRVGSMAAGEPGGTLRSAGPPARRPPPPAAASSARAARRDRSRRGSSPAAAASPTGGLTGTDVAPRDAGGL